MTSAQTASARPLVETEVIAGEARVLQELDVHDVPLDKLLDAIRYALAEFNQVTQDDPRQFGAQAIYAKLTRGLRETGRILGWQGASENGFETVVNSSGAWAITAANGSPGTGDPDGQPSTRAQKGRMSKKAIVETQQMVFPGMLRPAIFDLNEDLRNGEQGVETFFLLMRVGPADGCAYAELSLPLGPIGSRDRDGRVPISIWSKRIILPVIGPGGGVLRWPETSSTEDRGARVDEIEVDVARRRQGRDERFQRPTSADRSNASSDDQDGAR